MAIKIDLILKFIIIGIIGICVQNNYVQCLESESLTAQQFYEKLNQPCVNVCTQYNHSVCYDKVCYCGVNYIWNNVTKECVSNKCVNDAECRDYDPNRVCLTGKCDCFSHYEESSDDPYMCTPLHPPPPNFQFLWFLSILPAFIFAGVLCCYFRREKKKKFTFRIEGVFDRDILFNPNRDQLFTITPSQSPQMFSPPQAPNLPPVSPMRNYTEPALMVPTTSRNMPTQTNTQSFLERAYPPPYTPLDPLHQSNQTENTPSYGFNPQHIYTKQAL